MLDKDKKIILFNFCPKKFGIDYDDIKRAQEVQLNIFESLRAGFDESIKLITLFTFNESLPILEVIEKPSRKLKKKLNNYLDYIRNCNDISNITAGDEYKELLEELNKE